ncbi:MAG: GNAT family N-acetyltransferase, partial [Caldilineaceae bacterium]|nr:GNAT family N-acetyltransferase [Caldilineaceae bacterium]
EAGAELLAVWVSPEHRGRKVGAALVEYACNWALERGVQTMIVGVFADNTGAINFYEGVGFLNGGEVRNDPRQPHRPILILSMELTGRLATS